MLQDDTADVGPTVLASRGAKMARRARRLLSEGSAFAKGRDVSMPQTKFCFGECDWIVIILLRAQKTTRLFRTSIICQGRRQPLSVYQRRRMLIYERNAHCVEEEIPDLSEIVHRATGLAENLRDEAQKHVERKLMPRIPLVEAR